MKQQALTGFEPPRIKRAEDGESSKSKSLLGHLPEAQNLNPIAGLVAMIASWVRQKQFLYCLSRLECGIFDAQTRFINSDEFSDWLKVGIGWCVWAPGPNGGIVPVAKSMHPRRLPTTRVALSAIYRETVDFINSEHAARFLWPEALPRDRASRVANILKRFA
jgi:hypothetical protein